jgi:hypothetical protein
MIVLYVTGLILGWSAGLVIATAAWLVWLALTVKSRS